MKIYALILTSILSFFFLSNTYAQSGTKDEGVVFEVETTFIGDSFGEISSPVYNQAGQVIKSFSAPSAVLMKQLKLPKPTKIFSKPIILKHNGNCYAFGCQKNAECDQCRMLWWDRNGDGKVQPRKELRCACPGVGNCRVRVKRVDCK